MNKPLRIILPQMSGYKYNEKYNEIWDVIKNKLYIKFHSLPVYDENT